MRRPIIAALLAVTVVAAPSVALAGKRDTARTTIAAAKAKIDLNEKNGITGAAADIQSRARTALDKAQKEFGDSEENAAISAGREADALAELASSTQQRQLAENQAATAAQPQR